MRQASRRAWRVGQTLDCRVFYLYYKHSAQEVVMRLMSRKMLASMSLEGNFDSEGLAALAGENIATRNNEGTRGRGRG